MINISKRYIFLLFSSILTIVSFLTLLENIYGAQRERSADVFANIPSKVKVLVYGYTAANSIVQAEGVRVFAQTSSDPDGYFEIYPLYISYQTEEVCFTTIDSDKRVGFPLCLPFTQVEEDQQVGPLLLSPTLSLSKTDLYQNDTAYASGRTIPNADVEISFFESSQSTFLSYIFNPFSPFVKQAFAYSAPTIQTVSNENGQFSVSLPVHKTIKYRVYAKAFFKANPTPKSNSLSYLVNSLLSYIIKNILPLLLFIIGLLLIIVLLYQVEIRDKFFAKKLNKLREKKLKPFVVKSRLLLARLFYKLKGWMKSNRK